MGIGGYPGARYGGPIDMMDDLLRGSGASGTGSLVRQNTPTLIHPEITTYFSVDGVVWGGNSTNYHYINDPSGTLAFQIGNATDPITYHSNGTHRFRSKDLTVNFAQISSAGLALYGSTSGSTILKATAIALGTLTLPAETGTLLSSASLDTDGTLAANSDAKIATQKAVKAYADQLIASADAMVFKGVVDCSANPNYPAADRGHTYRVSVAGKIGGASGTNVEAGDLLLCLTDGSASGTQAGVGASWTISQTNLDGAVIGPASVTADHFAQFNGTTGKLIKGGLALTTSTLLAGNSDTNIPSEKAVKAYADGNATTMFGALTSVTPAGADLVTLRDASDSNNAKTARADETAALAMSAPGYVSNLYYPATCGATFNASGVGFSADRLIGAMTYIGATDTFTKLGIEVTAAAGTLARLGIYNVSGGNPTTLLLDAGTVSTASTGIKEATISQQLRPGWYFLAVVFDGAPTCRGAVPNANQNMMPIGYSGVPGSLSDLVEVALPFAALPANFGTPTRTVGTVGFYTPLIWLRK